MKQTAVLGIDLGTSSVRALLIDSHGNSLALGAREYRVDMPHPGWSEQNPDTWWEATCEAVQECTSAAGQPDIRGISFSGQMHGTVIVDADCSFRRPAVIWADQRSNTEVEAFLTQFGRDTLAQATANPLATGFQLATLLWLMKHEPRSLEGDVRVLLPKDYLRMRMTGEFATESSDACSTLLFDTARREWSSTVLQAAGIPVEWLPPCGEATESGGVLTEKAAQELGIPPGIPVFLGAADQPATAIGNAVTEPGQVLSTIGSGGQLFAPQATPAYDNQTRTHTFCHAMQDRWYVMGAILSAGLSFKWLRNQVYGPDAASYAELTQDAEPVPPGTEGLMFLPYLTGERTPHMDPDACGVFFGLTPRHGRAHTTRAVMEGVVLALSEGLDIQRSLGIQPETVIAAGGGASSRLWRQIQADIYECPVTTAVGSEQAGHGAALIASVGAGWWKSIPEACAATVQRSDDVIEPVPAHSEIYRDVKEGYRSLYRLLKDEMKTRAEFVRRTAR